MSVFSEHMIYNEYFQKDITHIKEEYLLEVIREIRFHEKPKALGRDTVRILEEIEVDDYKYSIAEVLYNEARASIFTIGNGAKYFGYTFNQYWNGWDCPYFTKETALKFCVEYTFKCGEEEECRCFYDEATDTFYCEDWSNNYKRTEIGVSSEINTPEGKIKAYDFGVAGWLWHEVE